MNEDIMLLTNELVYDGKLKIGSASIAQRELNLPDATPLAHSEQWLQDVLDPRLAPFPTVENSNCRSNRIVRSHSRKVVFIDTDLLPAREKKTVSLVENETEARLVLEVSQIISRRDNFKLTRKFFYRSSRPSRAVKSLKTM